MRRLIGAAALAVAVTLGGTPAHSDTLELAAGGTLAYESHGSGDRHLILIHGYSMAKEVWDKVVPLIEGDVSVHAYDLAGFGASYKPAQGYAYADMMADLEGFMDGLDIDSAVLAGHSLGGIFIQDFAIAHPDRVEALVLSNAQARNKPPIGMTEAYRERIASFGDAATNAAVFEKLTPVYFKPENLSEDDLETILQMNAKAATPALRQAITTVLTAEAIPAAEFADIDVPVLVIASTHDIVPFEVSVALLDALPSARLAVIERSGHTPMWEKPEAFAAELNEFLEGLD